MVILPLIGVKKLMSDTEINPLATSVAALIAEDGYSWNEAKSKILQENSSLSFNALPKNDDIASALREHYAIYDPQGHRERLLEMRKTALIVMTELERFRPLLTKGVLNGCADKFSDIYLYLESEDVKAVEIFLLDMNLDIEVSESSEAQKTTSAEEIVFEAPQRRDGYFRAHDIPLLVRATVFERYPHFSRKRKKKPDQWQIEAETMEIATIDELKELINLTENS